jgi:hypothetical protein
MTCARGGSTIGADLAEANRLEDSLTAGDGLQAVEGQEYRDLA